MMEPSAFSKTVDLVSILSTSTAFQEKYTSPELILLETVRNKILQYIAKKKRGDPAYKMYRPILSEQSSNEYIAEDLLADIRLDHPSGKSRIFSFLYQNYYDIRAFGHTICFPRTTIYTEGAIQMGISSRIPSKDPFLFFLNGQITRGSARKTSFSNEDWNLFVSGYQSLSKDEDTVLRKLLLMNYTDRKDGGVIVQKNGCTISYTYPAGPRLLYRE